MRYDSKSRRSYLPMIGGASVFALAAGLMPTAADAQSAPAPSASSTPTVSPPVSYDDDIVVTARKREERLRDVPMSITAITAEDISKRNLVNAEDYLRGLAGVNEVDSPQGQGVIIRGIETSPVSQNFGAGATTATYFGETPTTDAAGIFSSSTVDIKLIDIERVEVLRGPQGTAFGSSSMGGAVRTIPALPNTDKFEARIAAGYSRTSGTGGDNYNIQLVGNAPLVQDKLAVRAVAYRYRDSGFYRNVAGSDTGFQSRITTPYGTQALPFALNRDQVGGSLVQGARFSMLFKPADNLTFTVGYLTQKNESDGVAVASSGGYNQTMLQVSPEHTVRNQTGGLVDTNINIFNATVNYDVGVADILATYSRTTSGSLIIVPYQFFGRDWPLDYDADSKHRSDSGEVRLTTKFNGPVNLLAGVFIENPKDIANVDYIWYGDPAKNLFGAGNRFTGHYIDDRDISQKAAFGELTVEPFKGFKVTGGARFYQYNRRVSVNQIGVLFNPTAPTTAIVTNDRAKASGSTFKANISYKPSENALVYAGFAQGFRLGKPQPGLTQCDRNGDGTVDGTNISVASTKVVNSDSVNSYEAGAKVSLFGRRLGIDAAVFRMDWSELPVSVIGGSATSGCGFTYIANAGKARSEGVELQMNLRVTPNVRLDVGGSYINARLTQNVPVQNFRAGDRLPGTPKWNGNLGLEYEFKLGGHEAYLRTDAIYVGEFYGDILRSPTLKAGDYVKIDLSGRIQFDRWNVDLFVRNLTNSDAFVFKGPQARVTSQFGYRLRPLTAGFQIGYKF